MSGLAKRVSVSEGINRYPPQTHHTQCLASKDNRDQIERTIIVMIMINGVAELGSLSSRGRAEQEPRISIPVPAVPVSELLAGKKPENL